MSPRGHERADRRNLHLHRAALDQLRRDPELRQRCRALLERWLADPEQRHARRYLESWRQMLASWSLEEMSAVVLDAERGQALRQCSPLGPTLSPRERWRLLAEINRALDAEAAEGAEGPR